MKNTVILFSGVLLMAVSACTSGLSAARQAIDEAPDWYDERRLAASKDGFPELTRVPEPRVRSQENAALLASRDEVLQAELDFSNDPRAAPADLTPEEIRAEAAAIRQDVLAMNTPPQFLTEAEIEDIRNSFNIGRAKLRF